MDAKKVLAVLRAIEYGGDTLYCPGCGFLMGMPHRDGCSLAALIAEAEQEAQTGGWNPGTEPPPEREVVEVQRSNPMCAITFRYFGYMFQGVWRDYQTAVIIDDVKWWHALPPLPEQTP